jgi:acetyltransferase-like isoleucine patch superfamily enzyme
MLIGAVTLLAQNLIHRYRLSRLRLEFEGDNIHISQGFIFDQPSNISIGSNVYIGPNSFISAIGKIRIGSGTIMGPRVTIYSANHNWKGANAIPYDDKVITKAVDIGENIWIGGNVIIVPGVTLGEGCIVAAGSVVTRDFSRCEVLGGNPARPIGHRDEEHYFHLKSRNQIYLALKTNGTIKPHIWDGQL